MDKARSTNILLPSDADLDRLLEAAEWYVTIRGVGHGAQPGVKTIQDVALPQRLSHIERSEHV